MTLHNFLLFISACIALALIPGPDMAYMLARCIAQGRRAGVLAALGFNLGGLVHATAAAPINLLLVLFSSRFTQTLRGNAAVSRWLQRGMGTLFIALGLRLAVEKT